MLTLLHQLQDLVGELCISERESLIKVYFFPSSLRAEFHTFGLASDIEVVSRTESKG